MTSDGHADRRHLLSPVISKDRWAAAAKEQRFFVLFCDRLKVPANGDALCLYLTWKTDQGTTVRTTRQTLARLDLAARLSGRPAWTGDPDIRRFMRGLHSAAGLGSSGERADPLYRELLDVLVETVMAPTRSQVRDRAIVLIAWHAGTPAQALSRVTWRHVRWVGNGAVIEIPPVPGSRGARHVDLVPRHGHLCPVQALRRLREATGIDGGHVFGGTGQERDALRILRTTRLLGRYNNDLTKVLRAVSVTPRQLRDRAALVIGYGAALRHIEARQLLQRDLKVTQDGLLVTVPGRSHATGIPTNPGLPCDPVAAWSEWLDAVAAQGRNDTHEPAFPRISGTRVWRQPLQRTGLNGLVTDAVKQADLDGHYTYASLRVGYIRTALRASERAHEIAGRTDLSLRALAIYDHRENLIRHSVAGQLGL